jgi:predicted kinase
MNRDRSLIRHFGLQQDALYWSTLHETYANRIRDAIESRRLIAVIGGFGSGKSTLVQEAIGSLQSLEVIYVDNSDRERLRIGNITQVMVSSLTTETPRRDNTSRQFQLSRVIGEAVLLKRREVVVIIENAHRLHHETLLALKDLRESVRYKGQNMLFSVILVGQESLRAKLDRFGEVAFRTRPIELDRNDWMSHSERMGYLEAVYGQVLTPRSRDRIALLCGTPLEMDYIIEEKLLRMREAGLNVLDESVMPMSLREQRELLKVSYRDLERVSGVPRSTILDAEKGDNKDPQVLRSIQLGLDKLAEHQRAA